MFLAGSAANVLTACGSNKKAALPAYGRFNMQLFWVKNVSAAPEFLGVERRVWENQGFDGVELLPAGTNIDPKVTLYNGTADMATLDSPSFAKNAKEHQLVGIGARLAKSPTCVVSLPANPIRKPADIAGKRIGVQPVYEGVWKAFLKFHNIDESSVKQISVATDPKPLQDGQVDGFFSWVVNQPVLLRVRNVPYVTMLLSDFGLSLYDHMWTVTKKRLEENRERVVAGLRAEAISQSMFIRDYETALDLSLNKYAKNAGDDPTFARFNLTEVRDFINAFDVVHRKGLGYMEPEVVERNVKLLQSTGADIDASFFDNSLMEEIYKDGPELLKKYENSLS